jgi:hypothetical protein
MAARLYVVDAFSHMKTINLRRLTMNVFENNPRAIRITKNRVCGRGQGQKVLHREGQRYDMIYMAIFREEWDRLPVPQAACLSVITGTATLLEEAGFSPQYINYAHLMRLWNEF